MLFLIPIMLTQTVPDKHSKKATCWFLGKSEEEKEEEKASYDELAKARAFFLDTRNALPKQRFK